MARYCLDASFVLGWLIPGQRTASIEARWLSFSLRDELLAPPFILAECTSALLTEEYDQRLAPDRVRNLARLLLRLPIRLVDRRDSYERAFDMARALNWRKIYDAVYIAVAEFEGAELLTLDVGMHRGALRLSVPSTLAR